VLRCSSTRMTMRSSSNRRSQTYAKLPPATAAEKFKIALRNFGITALRGSPRSNGAGRRVTPGETRPWGRLLVRAGRGADKFDSTTPDSCQSRTLATSRHITRVFNTPWPNGPAWHGILRAMDSPPIVTSFANSDELYIGGASARPVHSPTSRARRRRAARRQLPPCTSLLKIRPRTAARQCVL
jgi:hypothetical protein